MRSGVGMRSGLLLCATAFGCAGPPTDANLSERDAGVAAAVVPSVLLVGPTTLSTTGVCPSYSASTSGFSGSVTLKWHSSDTRVAQVFPSPPTGFANVCGISDGFAAIWVEATGSSEGQTHNVVSNVIPVDVGQPVRLVRITPNPIAVKPGVTVQLTAVAVDQYGNTRNKAATWSSSNPAVATVSSTGLARGVAPGTATISATAGGRTSTATLTTGITGVTIVGPASISTQGVYQFSATVSPSGTYSYIWEIIQYGDNQHYTKTGNPISIGISLSTGSVSMRVRIYQSGVYLGSSGTKVVGISIGGGGGCTGKIC
jgi:hypothetical protein